MGTTAANKTRRQSQPATLELLDWAPRGTTRADWNGRTVQVDRGIPGEQVVAEITRGRRPLRGVVAEVLRPSSLRVAPSCEYYLRGCGGCQWQHMAYDAQVETKRELVDRELEQAGLACRVQRVHAMDQPWRYRYTAAIALGWEAGFRPRGRRGIIEIHDCPISHPLIGSLAHQMNEVLRTGLIPNYHGKVWLDCTVVGSKESPEVQVVIQGIEGLTLESHPELPQVARTISALSGVGSVAYRHRDGSPVPLEGSLFSGIVFRGRELILAAGSFFQANLTMLSCLLDVLESELEGREIGQAADIYGGVGTFAFSLAGHVGHMTLIELDELAIASARQTADSSGIQNMAFIAGHAETALNQLPSMDMVIVDPPRSGLGSAVTAAIAENKPPLICYVSCAPGSLAADVSELTSHGYGVRRLEIFDFYPQTYHVESLAILAL